MRRALNIVVGLLLAAFAASGSVQAQSGYEIFRGSDMPGSDYMVIKGGGYDHCVSACSRDGDCQAFTFNTEKKVCFLKSSGGTPTRFAGAISGRKGGDTSTSSKAGGFELFTGMDMPGGDYDVIRNVDLDQCRQSCATDPQCSAFTQNTDKNVCFLKGSAGEPERFAGAVSGRKTAGGGREKAAPKGKSEDGFTIYADTDLPGGDGSILDQQAGSLEACRLQCLFNDGCDAFTYNHNVNACLGKSDGHIGWNQMKPTPFKGATSGMKASPEKVLAARLRYKKESPKVPVVADLLWRDNDTAAAYVARIREASRSMGGPCDAERAAMETIASAVEANLADTTATAGGIVTLDWKTRPDPKAPPVWLMISTDGPVRFEAPAFYALTPGAIAPFGLAVDSGRTRALTTLFGRGSVAEGSVKITPLRAGSLDVAVRVVSYLRACGEEFQRDVKNGKISVAASTSPTFQVRDPFSFERPKKTWLSPNGETRLEVFDGRFRVVEMASGAFIADREGLEPHYSPTGRYVTFNVGESGYDIIDTIDGAVVGTTNPSVVGWENNDSFLVEGWTGAGGVMAHNLLVKDVAIGGAPGCRICGGRDESYALSLENDFVHDGAGRYAQRLSGERQVSKVAGDDGQSIVRFAAEETAAAPVALPSGWNFRGGLKFVPYELWGDPENRVEPSATDREELAHMFRAEEISGEKETLLTGLQPVGIGEWRGAVQLVKPPRRGSDALSLRLQEIGLRFSPDRPASYRNDGAFGEGEGIAKMIVASVPAMKKLFVRPDQRSNCSVHYDVPDAEKKVFPEFNQAVKYEIGERSVWLTMFSCVDGSAAFFSSTFLLIDSDLKGGFKHLGARNPNSDIGTECHGDISYCEFESRLYDDHLLLIWSRASRAIVLLDINADEPVFTEFNLGRGDLLKEAFYSVADRQITQVNTDGSFYVYDVSGKKRIMEGRYVDDEVIAWTPDLRFDASPEGANYVNLRFPGQSGQYAFQQFASRVKRPGLVREVLERRYTPSTQVLSLPPRLSGDVSVSNGRIAGKVAQVGAAQLRIYQDGLLTDTVPVSPDQSEIGIDVAHAPGARWVSLVAYGGDGVASLPIGRDVVGKAAATPTIHALTVGIDRYDGGGLKSLSYGKRDAATLLDAIKAQDGKSLRVGVTATLADDAATPDAILERARTMISTARKGDTIVFSFAGHGVTGPDGRFYLATSTTDAGSVPTTALAWDRLAAVLAGTDARVLVFLDACHSGAAGTGLFATNDDAADAVRGGIPSGLLVFSASKGRQFSEESPVAGGGLFTNAVADVIARDRAAYDLDGNGAIEISEFYVGVKRKVSEQSEGRQVPWLARNELIGDFAIF